MMANLNVRTKGLISVNVCMVVREEMRDLHVKNHFYLHNRSLGMHAPLRGVKCCESQRYLDTAGCST